MSPSHAEHYSVILESSRLLHRSSRSHPLVQHFRMLMHTRHDPNTNCPPHSLGHPPLVDSPQPSISAMPDSPHFRYKFTHHCKVFVFLQWIHTQIVQNIPSTLLTRVCEWQIIRPIWQANLSRFCHFNGRQIVRRVDIAIPPVTCSLRLNLANIL